MLLKTQLVSRPFVATLMRSLQPPVAGSHSRGSPSVLDTRIYAAPAPWRPNIQRQPKQQIKPRVFKAHLIPRQQVLVPVSARSVRQLKRGRASPREKSVARRGDAARQEVNGSEEEQLLTLRSTYSIWFGFFPFGGRSSGGSSSSGGSVLLASQTLSSRALLSEP